MLYQLDNGWLIQVYDSDNNPLTEGCDCVLGYNLFDTSGKYLDGGEYDYDSNTTSDIYEGLIEFATGEKQKWHLLVPTSDTGYEDITELFAELRESQLKHCLAHCGSNPEMKVKIQSAINNLTHNL